MSLSVLYVTCLLIDQGAVAFFRTVEEGEVGMILFFTQSSSA